MLSARSRTQAVATGALPEASGVPERPSSGSARRACVPVRGLMRLHGHPVDLSPLFPRAVFGAALHCAY